MTCQVVCFERFSFALPSMVKPVKELDWIEKQNELMISNDVSLDDEDSLEGGQNNNSLQWVQGKAGEDWVHVIV